MRFRLKRHSQAPHTSAWPESWTEKFSQAASSDFVLGDHEIAIEVKSTGLANASHLKGLRRFKEEYSVRRSILVSLDPKPRTTEDQIEILPWQTFLEQLWAGEL